MLTRHRIVLIALGFGLSASLAFGQSLAEVAKKEKERRKANKSEKGEPVRVIDEKGLQEARGPGVIAESTVETGADDDDVPRRVGREGVPYELTVGAEKERARRRSEDRASSDCDRVASSLNAAERRFNAGVTVTERVPGRVARGVRTGVRADGSVIVSDVPTYEEREKHVSCSSAEGRKTRGCQSLQEEIDSLRVQLRRCRS